MGNVCKTARVGQYNTSASARLAEQLGIDDRTLNRLEKVFCAIDFDGSGEVSFTRHPFLTPS
jgi:hypothetical protein